MICLGKPIARTNFFESLKILVETHGLHSVEGNLILTLKDLGFATVVREIGQQGSNSSHTETQCSSSPSMEATVSNDGVLGFDNIKDETASRADMARSGIGGGRHNES